MRILFCRLIGNKKGPKAMIKLWRTTPVIKRLKNKDRRFPLPYIFPSGRQALSYALNYAGLGRANRVALPEWSSHCVVSAIGKYSASIPLREVIKYKIKVDAVLVYEQWGWPISKKALKQLGEYFKESILILDMVDSAHFRKFKFPEDINFKTVIQIISFSKLLGLSQGALLIYNNQYLTFEPEEESIRNLGLLEGRNIINNASPAFVNSILKDNLVALNKKVKLWFKQNDLFGAIETERRARQENLQHILKNKLSYSWPHWMRQAINDGVGPVIAPLLKGKAQDGLEKVKKFLIDVYKIETRIYHFNWSGNPLKPVYEKCLAFPVHSSVRNVRKILNDINIKNFN